MNYFRFFFLQYVNVNVIIHTYILVHTYIHTVGLHTVFLGYKLAYLIYNTLTLLYIIYIKNHQNQFSFHSYFWSDAAAAAGGGGVRNEIAATREK